MIKRILSLLLALLMVVGMFPVTAFAADYSEDIGKFATMNAEYPDEFFAALEQTPTQDWKDNPIWYYPSDFSEDILFEITDYTVVTDIYTAYDDENMPYEKTELSLWYQVNVIGGTAPVENVEESIVGFENGFWIQQQYLNEEDAGIYPDVLVLSNAEDHVWCEICGKYDCGVTHETSPSDTICEICGAEGCTEVHLYCLACEKYLCDEDHVFCGYCNRYDCGVDHFFEPVTEPVIPENPVLDEETDVSVLDKNGNAVTELILQTGTKTSLSAWADMENASYQWQIRYDAVDDLWADIQGQTGKGILVSPAMVANVAEPAIRCAVTAGEETKFSEAIPVSIMEMASFASFALNAGAESLAETEDPDPLGKAYVVVQYQYSDGRTAAASAIAECIPGIAYSKTYDIPSIPGYQATIKDQATLGSHASIADGKLTVTYAAEEMVAGEYHIITVEYIPDYVNFTVIHYWQNVDNDNYTENERETVGDKYKTGEQITAAHKPYPGFYNLLYETPTAAADGSTVIEVYYDRYYYLMTFDLGENGYGVDPVYARFGDSLEIGTPIRPGYEFNGWADADGNSITIPDTVPKDGGTYYAQWTPVDTEYTVAYWILNEDGTRSLIGTKTEAGTSNSTVSGQDDVATLIICGETEHTHTSACYNCGHESGKHIIGCYAGSLVSTGELTSESNTNDWNAIMAVNGGQTPENGTLYFIQSDTDIASGTYWPKLYLDGKYYNITVNGKPSIGYTDLEIIVDGAQIGQAKDVFTATKYRARLNTLICTSHSHTDECFVNTRHLEYLDDKTAKNVTVNGDGSTIVDVYYQYKEYTLKFYYAAEVGGAYKVVGGSTYYFGSGTDQTSTPNTDDDATLLAHQYAQAGEWGGVDELPQLNVIGQDRKYTKGSITNNGVTYHYISFTARYGDDISDMWPCSVFYSVTRTDKNNSNGWSGKEAFVSAWNGEYRVKYSQDHDPSKSDKNQTIKGIYEKLDDNLLFAAEFEDSTEVSYLCFWENGANVPWNVPELYRYKIWVEALPYELTENNTHINGLPTQEYGEVVYKLIDTYDTCDDSTVAQQTQPGLTGYVKNGYTSSKIADFDTELYSEAYEVNFFYLAERYTLKFWNHNDWLGDGEGAGNTQEGTGVAYGTPLKVFGDYVNNEFMAKPENYPDTLEPGAYEFAGWYTTADCLPETEMDWSRTMPDSDMTVYAKWIPVSRTVKFFLTRESLTRGEDIPAEMGQLATAAGITEKPYSTIFGEKKIQHGTYIGELSEPGVFEGYEKIHPRAGYDFVGWFYLDEAGEETAFDPENMPVTQDLNLYAKWSSNTLCMYNVYFALDVDGKEGADTDENGNILYVADPVSGSGIAGRTYTFSAKGGEGLYATYREGYFPTVGSHSIVIDIQDENGTGANSFTFLYQQKNAVPYTVKYLEAGTNNVLYEEKKVDENKNVVVTENFVYILGYMPDAYQKTLVVTADGKNEIIFYYTEDTTHALYVVNYYIQELNGDLTHKGWSEYTSLQNTGDIGTEYSADAIIIDGFTLSKSYTDDYNNKKINGMSNENLPAEVGVLTDGKISGKLTDKGMELNFYYTRNLYPYEFRYMLSGTTTELAPPEVGKAGYDTVVTEAAKQIEMDLDGDGVKEDYQLYDPTETTKDIHIKVDGKPLNSNDTVSEGDATVNVATFYYVRCTQTMTITKKVEGKGVSSAPDPHQEFQFSLLIHSTSGYHRNSYEYSLSDGTNTTNGTLTPEVSAPNTLQFALKDGQTITIEGLPTAEYTLTELNVPTGYYPSYSGTQENGRYKLTVNEQVNAVVENSYEPADLIIGKQVQVEEVETNTPERSDFEFTVVFPENVTPAGTYVYILKDANGNPIEDENSTAAVSNGTMTVTLQNGQTATFLNLPVGSYTVTETDYSADGYDSNYIVDDGALVDGNQATVSLVRNTQSMVSFVNLFPVGSITINKKVEKEFYSDEWAGDAFTFTVKRSNKDLVKENQYRYKIDSVDQKNEDGTWKLLTVDNSGVLTGTITFPVNDPKESHTLTILDLPAGTYEVTETESTNGLDKYTTKVAVGDTPEEIKTGTVVLKTGAFAQTVNITNILNRYYGTLEISKKVELDGVDKIPDSDKQDSFEITVTLTGDRNFNGPVTATYSMDAESRPVTINVTNGSFTVSVKDGETVTITQIPAVTFTVTETNYQNYDEVITLTKGDNSVATDWKIPANDIAGVLVTNRYPVNQGTLTITKQVKNAPAGETQSFIFHVTGDGVDMDVTINGDGRVTISEMPLGSYTVTEDTSWSWRYTCDNASRTVEITAGERNPEITFVNTYQNSKWINFTHSIRNVFTQSTVSNENAGTE